MMYSSNLFAPLPVGGSRGRDSVLLPNGRNRGLNVAVSGDWAGGAPDQARALVTRMARLPGYTNTWKLVTVQLGGNDLCAYSCDSDRDTSPRAWRVRELASLRFPK